MGVHTTLWLRCGYVVAAVGDCGVVSVRWVKRDCGSRLWAGGVLGVWAFGVSCGDAVWVLLFPPVLTLTLTFDLFPCPSGLSLFTSLSPLLRH